MTDPIYTETPVPAEIAGANEQLWAQKTAKCLAESPTLSESSLNEKQAKAIQAAFLDLIGASQSCENKETSSHDWDSHHESIHGLWENFPVTLADFAADYDRCFPDDEED